MVRAILRRVLRLQWIVLAGIVLVPWASWAQTTMPPTALPTPQPTVAYRLHGGNERLQMVVNTSRILTIGQKIPQAQVNDPQVVTITPLSPTEVQISAKKPGVTQVNLWGEDQRIYTLDLIVFGDAQELNMIIRQEYPNSTVKAIALSKGVLLTGYVDQPESISRIVKIAEQFYSKDTVLNNMSVGGVQLVHLHVKIMEVSRTKLRTLGFDWAKVTNGNSVISSVSGLVTSASSYSSDATFAVHVTNGTSSFLGVLEALRQDNLAKILADPTLVTVSGRPARFQVGGEFPFVTPGNTGTVNVAWKDYGTKIDFVPLVLGNGKIHLDVRPEVSDVDTTTGVVVDDLAVPGIKTRFAETGVEMNAGQTLAIAGLLQSRDEAENRGLPWVSEVPYVGALFRRVQHRVNEVELLILVTPELVEAMDPQEVPPCGPGMRTTRPNDVDLYWRGHLEVPNCCPTCSGAGCAHCDHGKLPPAPAAEPGLILDATQSSTAKPVPVKGQGPALARPENPQRPYSRTATATSTAAAAERNSPPAFIGPTGYQGK
jgi:pilus assembly protein CpaC